jgi:hypothetical protein
MIAKLHGLVVYVLPLLGCIVGSTMRTSFVRGTTPQGGVVCIGRGLHTGPYPLCEHFDHVGLLRVRTGSRRCHSDRSANPSQLACPFHVPRLPQAACTT